MDESTETFWGDEIQAERTRQDKQWGGPAHDDLHSPREWLDLIYDQIFDQIAQCYDKAHYRQRLVKIAALAVAAMEAFDRAEKGG